MHWNFWSCRKYNCNEKVTSYQLSFSRFSGFCYVFSCLKKPTIHSVTLHEIPSRNNTCITKLGFPLLVKLKIFWWVIPINNWCLIQFDILMNFWDVVFGFFFFTFLSFNFCLQYVKVICECTYEISPNTLKASFSWEVSISGLRSPTNMWKCSARDN